MLQESDGIHEAPNGPPEPWRRLLTIIIPAFNEVDGIGQTLTTLRARLPEAFIIVVDDASNDGTPERARQTPGVRVVSHGYNCGYGGALKTGMVLAQTEYVAWFDADGEHRVEDLVSMVSTLHKDKLIAVIGQRTTGSSTRLRAAGKWVIRMLAQSLDFRAGSDLNCGLRVYRRDVICRYLYVLPDGYSASLTSLMVMLERRYPVAFHPVQTKPRIGTSKVRLSDGVTTLTLVIRIAMLFAPLRIFLRGGAALIVASFIYGLLVTIFRGAGFPVAGALGVMAGLLLISVGLIADQISQLRLIQLASLSSLPYRPVKFDSSTDNDNE
jgi:glycosyltransferase involved in cell wall biosynthesis